MSPCGALGTARVPRRANTTAKCFPSVRQPASTRMEWLPPLGWGHRAQVAPARLPRARAGRCLRKPLAGLPPSNADVLHPLLNQPSTLPATPVPPLRLCPSRRPMCVCHLQCHPREEHLIPLMVAAGAAGDSPGHTNYSDTIMGATISGFVFQ